MPHALTVDGTLPDGSLHHDPDMRAPFFVFDADKQDHVAGPFATYTLAEAALSELAGERPGPARRLWLALQARWMDSLIAAFLLGVLDMRRGEFGRTHDSDGDWNESYDRGGNAAEWWSLRPCGPRPFDGSSYTGR